MANLNQDDGASNIAAGTVIDGRYKVVKSLGQGGNGLVHEVEHVRTGRRLALKSLLDEAGYGRLEQEARATSLISNSHAAKITDMGTSTQTGPYLVMELLEGQSLRALLDEAGQLPLELMVNIALQVCECLEEAHHHGIVHRDLKPENVFLCKSPWVGQHDVKVLDFGVVKISNDGPIPNNSLTRTGSTVGTPYYMSLEQLRNSSAVDSRADIYALGVVLYESLSGRKPFQAETIGDLVYALCSGPPTHLARLRPDLPAEFTDMIMRALSANKDDRPKSMTEFAAAMLQHGNSAFGLWMRVDGKQPALARPRSGTHPATPAQAAVAAPATAAKPPTSAPAAPRPLKSTLPLNAAAAGAAVPVASRLPAPPVAPTPGANKTMALWTDAALEGGPAPGTGVAIPQPVDETTEGGPRRDTPTEMYKGGGDDGPGASSSGDRDTPTRAIPAPNFDKARLAPMPTMKSSAYGDEPTGELPNPIGNGPPDVALMQTVPASAIPHIPGFEQGASQPQLMVLGSPRPSLVDSPFKPAWQKTLDNLLVTVGRKVDGWMVKFRNAPQNTKILVVACGASVILFLGVLLFVLIS